MTTPYPLAVPTLSGSVITVDTMLKEPTRITRALADMTLKRLIAQRIFATPGGVQGGALLYDQITANDVDLDSTRQTQNVEPGAEFPIVTSTNPTPKVATVEKIGGKFFVTDEARDRNDDTLIAQGTRRLANNLVLGINSRAIAALELAVTAHSRTATGVNWGTAGTTAAGSVTAAGSPAADFAKAQLNADVNELGTVYNLWIVHPNQMAAFVTFYGAANYRSILEASGVEMVASNRVTAGTAYVVEESQVGEMRFEQGLTTETWREQATERTWVQSSVRPVFAVTNPFSVLKFTGLAG